MKEYIDLLKQLIATPSISKEEAEAAEIIRDFLKEKEIPFKTAENNTWAYSKNYTKGKPTIMLNSHIDTVKPAKDYTNDPFTPI